MDADYWLESWRRDHMPFHQRQINPHLQAYWPRLDPGPGRRVFVPLCGRSRDMLWLNSRERGVLGVELAAEPLSAFFEEAGLLPETETLNRFRSWKAPGIELLEGDIFDLDPAATADCGAWYDRAALPALPPDLRRRYADKITLLAQAGCRGLMIVPEYDPSRMDPPPFSISHHEIEELFAPGWSLELVHDEPVAVAPRFAARGLDALRERVYLLERRF